MNGDGSELELNCWSIFIHIRVTLHFLTCHNINPHERQARVATIYAHDLELYMCVIFFGTYGEVKLCLCTYSDHTHTKLHDVTIPSITLHYLTLISLRYVLHFLGVCLCLLYLALAWWDMQRLTSRWSTTTEHHPTRQERDMAKVRSWRLDPFCERFLKGPQYDSICLKCLNWQGLPLL